MTTATVADTEACEAAENLAASAVIERCDLLYVAEHLAQMVLDQVPGRVIVRLLGENEADRTGDLGIVDRAHTRTPCLVVAPDQAEWAGADPVRDWIERAAARFCRLASLMEP